MNTSSYGLFSTVPEADPLSLFGDTGVDYQKVKQSLAFQDKDISSATGIPMGSVRYDVRIPIALKTRLTEWALLLNLVAEQFGGDAEKTFLWFTVSNPLLGNVSPRDMIRVGNYKSLLKFIQNARAGNLP